MKRETIKVTLNMDSNLLKRIEEYARSLGINRTSAMSVLMSQSLDQKEMISIMEQLQDLISKLEKSNKAD